MLLLWEPCHINNRCVTCHKLPREWPLRMHLNKRVFFTLILTAMTIVTIGCGDTVTDAQSVRIWHWMTDREEAFHALAKQYQEETGVPIRFELYAPSDLYVQKVRAAAQTDGLPDVYGVLGELKDLASFINADHVLRLDAAMEKEESAWKNKFFPLALAMSAFEEDNSYGVEPGVYGVPLDMMNVQIFYNKRLLAELGLDPESPPQSWDELLEVGALAKEKGKLGFVSGWAELWLLDCFATNYATHLMGQRKIENTFRGEIKYTDKSWLKVLNLFAELRDSGILSDGIVTMLNKRAEQLFANEKAVFAFNGTWGINVYNSMNPDLEYGVMMPPPIKKGRSMVTWGGAGASLMVNAQSEKAENAVAFLKWLTDEPQQLYLLEHTHNIPSNRLAAANLEGPLAAFADDMDSLIHPRLFRVQEKSPVIEAFNKAIQSIIIGEKTPEEAAKLIQNVKDHEMARRSAQLSRSKRVAKQ